MRVAALYDIHGNLPALEAVLDEVSREGVDRVVVGGDVLGPVLNSATSCRATRSGFWLAISRAIAAARSEGRVSRMFSYALVIALSRAGSDRGRSRVFTSVPTYMFIVMTPTVRFAHSSAAFPWETEVRTKNPTTTARIIP